MEKWEDLRLTSERQRSGIDRRLHHEGQIGPLGPRTLILLGTIPGSPVLGVDAAHVLYCTDKGWDVDLIEIQAPDVMQASFAQAKPLVLDLAAVSRSSQKPIVIFR